jgi:hypothetical protein
MIGNSIIRRLFLSFTCRSTRAMQNFNLRAFASHRIAEEVERFIEGSGAGEGAAGVNKFCFGQHAEKPASDCDHPLSERFPIGHLGQNRRGRLALAGQQRDERLIEPHRLAAQNADASGRNIADLHLNRVHIRGVTNQDANVRADTHPWLSARVIVVVLRRQQCCDDLLQYFGWNDHILHRGELTKKGIFSDQLSNADPAHLSLRYDSTLRKRVIGCRVVPVPLPAGFREKLP